MNKKILITGGGGYIGSLFVEKYSSMYQLTVLDTMYFGNNLNENQIHKFIKKDIRDLCLEDLDDIDIVLHMAELSNDPLGEINKDLTRQINIEGTKKLIELSKRSFIKKFIYMSSCSVYGDSGDQIVTEDYATNPLTEYAKAKYLNEQYLLNNEFEFEINILRNATAFGYSSNIRTDLVINDLTVEALNNDLIKVLSDGSPRRPFVHIGDICRFINYLIENDNQKKVLVNVGSDKLNYTVKEIAKIVSNITGVNTISFGKKDNDSRSYYVDFSKLTKLYPDFEFEFSIEDGIKEIQNNIDIVNRNKSNSKRLKKINSLLDVNLIDSNLFWIK